MHFIVNCNISNIVIEFKNILFLKIGLLGNGVGI